MIRLLTKTPLWIWLVLVWAAASLPNLSVRSFVWEEGTSAELARDILNRGDFLEPALHGVRDAEKPALLPWVIVGVSRLTGKLDEWSVRLPALISVLVTALLVFHVIRRHTSGAAAFFGAVCFLFCPLLLRKLTIAEPDTLITALSFAAFVVWWRGVETHLSVWHWLFCGVSLAVASMAKGPQPIAFFFLGAGAFTVARRRWKDLPGLFLALSIPVGLVAGWVLAVYRPEDLPIWLKYMRFKDAGTLHDYLVQRLRFCGGLPLDLIPGILLLPFLPGPFRPRRMGEQRTLIEALALYAGLATLALIFWPGANTRYAMPAAPAVAVMAGLVFDDLWLRHRQVAQTAVGIALLLFVYQVVLVCVIIPLFAYRFSATRTAGREIDRAIAMSPAPAFELSPSPPTNQLFYVSHAVRHLDIGRIAEIRPPAWLIIPRSLFGVAMQQNGWRITRTIETTSGSELIAGRVDRAEQP